MKLTKKQKELCRADREKVEALCRAHRWEEAHNVFCDSPWANESAKGSLEEFKVRQKARIRKEDGGLWLSARHLLATTLFFAGLIFSITAAAQGLSVQSEPSRQIAFLVMAFGSMGLAAVMYWWKKRLYRGF